MAQDAPQFTDRTALRVETLYRGADMEAQRRTTLELLALSPGEHVIDIGSGPGFLAEEMARQVDSAGRVLGLDISEAFLDRANMRNSAPDRLTYMAGDAANLPVADCSFDAAVCVQVLEYVAEVDRALAEMRRVLRPGGRALIIDTDWDSIVWRSDQPDRMRRILEAWESHCIHPFLPRSLPERLRSASFSDVRTSAHPIVNTSLAECGYSSGLCDLMRRSLRQAESPVHGEIEAWAAELSDLNAAGRYFFSLNRYVFLAQKP